MLPLTTPPRFSTTWQGLLSLKGKCDASHPTPNSQQPFTQHPFIRLCFQDITLSSHTASVLKATKYDLLKLKLTIWGNAFNTFWSNLQLGHLSLMLPTAGREQSAACCCCPRAKPKLPAGDEKGRDICMETVKAQQGSGCPLCHPFPVCSLFVTHRGKVGAQPCVQAAPLPMDFLLKTGMEGWGHSCKQYRFALSPTLAAHTRCHITFVCDTDVT